MLDPALAEARLAILAGPGVVRDGVVARLVEVAERTGLPVLNTWGAKGIFRWDSPYHAGTAGLQAEDFALAGLTEAEIVLAVGLDPAEAPPDRWAGPQVLEVEPWQLDTLVLRWPEPDPPAPRVATDSTSRSPPPWPPPTPPTRCRCRRRCRPRPGPAANRGALVTAHPGPPVLWVARALPTTEPGSVVVPATRVLGSALARGLVAGLDQRPALAGTTEPFDPTTVALVELGLAWHSPTVVVAWGADVALPRPMRTWRPSGRPGPVWWPAARGAPVALDQTRLLVDVPARWWPGPDLARRGAGHRQKDLTPRQIAGAPTWSVRALPTPPPPTTWPTCGRPSSPTSPTARHWSAARVAAPTPSWPIAPIGWRPGCRRRGWARATTSASTVRTPSTGWWP